jgi:2-keto-4-pentenoate hydratase/2-oxohepta-3-ene-1,7-dioic acid hydratase in catechol pathway
VRSFCYWALLLGVCYLGLLLPGRLRSAGIPFRQRPRSLVKTAWLKAGDKVTMELEGLGKVAVKFA